MGDYLISGQSVRGNKRNVYRTKEVCSINNQTGFIYLYSFEPEYYRDHEHYDELKDWAGIWMVSFLSNIKL